MIKFGGSHYVLQSRRALHPWRDGLLLIFIGPLILAACDKLDFGNDPIYPSQPEQRVEIDSNPVANDPGGSPIIGSLFEKDNNSPMMISVNGYLWRASLDTLAFMPLSSADPFGGVIITDWYSPPTTPDERFKITAYILGRSLQSDGIRVSVFRQARTELGDWINTTVNQTLASDLENTILTRAREFKVRNTAE